MYIVTQPNVHVTFTICTIHVDEYLEVIRYRVQVLLEGGMQVRRADQTPLLYYTTSFPTPRSGICSTGNITTC